MNELRSPVEEFLKHAEFHAQRSRSGIGAAVTMIRPVVPRTPQGCEECLRTGSMWIHLQLCLTCGHVGCCDSFPGRHAHRHAHAIGQAYDPPEDWRWCYYDETYV